MVLFGEASFAFYLLHLPLVGSLSIAAGGGRAWVVANAITFSLILLMAVGAHMVIERPAQRLLRRAFNRTNTGRPELAPAGIGRAESS
jgi:peptidoglycan/LPS O-acetylase OafA/YrhL